MSSNRDPINLNGKWWSYDSRTGTHRPNEAAASCHASSSASDLERPASHESVRAGKGAAFTARVNITIISYRTRLCDADGISAKAAIDGLTHCGVLQDDSPKEVSEVRYRQIKVKNASEEKTEIVIEED